MMADSMLSEGETQEVFALYKEVMAEHLRLLEYRDLLSEVAARADKTVSQLSEALPDDFKQLLADIEDRRASKRSIESRIAEFHQKLKNIEDEFDKLILEFTNNKKTVGLMSTMDSWSKLQILAQLGCVNSSEAVL